MIALQRTENGVSSNTHVSRTCLSTWIGWAHVSLRKHESIEAGFRHAVWCPSIISCSIDFGENGAERNTRTDRRGHIGNGLLLSRNTDLRNILWTKAQYFCTSQRDAPPGNPPPLPPTTPIARSPPAHPLPRVPPNCRVAAASPSIIIVAVALAPFSASSPCSSSSSSSSTSSSSPLSGPPSASSLSAPSFPPLCHAVTSWSFGASRRCG